MKLSASQICCRPEDETAVLREMQALGYAGFEIAPTRIAGPNPYENRAEVAVFAAAAKEEYGLALCSMQSIWFGQLGSMFGAERAFLLDYTHKAIAFAKAGGIGNLVFGCPKNRVLPEGKTEADALSFFKPLAEAAEKAGTCLALEANPAIYGTNFMNFTPDAFRVAAAVGRPGCKVNLDFGTLLQNDEDMNQIRGRVGEINHVHISEPYLAPVGRREEHRRLADMLREEDYQGYISLEMKAVAPEALFPILEYLAEVFTA